MSWKIISRLHSLLGKRYNYLVNTSDRYKPLPTVVRPPNIIGETFISTPGVCRTRIEREFPTRPSIVTRGISAPCNSFHKYSQAREWPMWALVNVYMMWFLTIETPIPKMASFRRRHATQSQCAHCISVHCIFLNYFSMDFDHGVPKFGIQLPQLPNFPNKYKCWKLIFEKWEINPKNLFGVFAQVKIGLKIILSQNWFCFIKGTFCANTPK